MNDPTYGELLAASEQTLVRAALSARDKLSDLKTASVVARGHADLIGAIRANARLFTRLPEVDGTPRQRPLGDSISELTNALDAFVSSPRFTDLSPQASERIPRDDQPKANHWCTAARLLHIAADTLGTHIGPDQAHRTADARFIDDPNTQRAVLRRLAEMTLTVGVAQHRLALRVHEVGVSHPRGKWLRAAADRMFDTHTPLTIAAANVVTGLEKPAALDAVTSLHAAPLLRPTRTADPVTAAGQSFDRIRLLAHRQARGELPVGIDAIRAYSTVAALAAMHAHAITAAASVVARRGLIDPAWEVQLKQVAQMLAEARTPWVAVTTATDRIASVRRSSRLLTHELDVFAGSLTRLTRNGSNWRDVDSLMPNSRAAARLLNLAAHLTEKLPELANVTTAVTNQLHARGDLLTPTRERDDIDQPYKWAPISAVRITALRNASAVVVAATNRANPAAARLLTTVPLFSRRLHQQRPSTSGNPTFNRGPTSHASAENIVASNGSLGR